MTLYSIFEKPQAKAAKDRAPIAVPERFSWFAMLLTPLHALAHGLWLVLALWVVLVVGLALASRLVGVEAAVLLYGAAATFVGFEAPALLRRRLVRTGWDWRGDMIAQGDDLALRDYLMLRK